jgi:hypothetical protein
LPFLVGICGGSRKDRFLSVLPELIRYRHRHAPVHRPDAQIRSLAQ